ncbi:hypothetical protein CK203_048955 [Vitis vinifera]|uniref:Uncharacterized protein n=1 Tax=Vitis vinifera TaxID=29760 RepID=A0A438GVG2_VITVI|nr:hypothetical protein CK203_048955 [Vitis vinifera]
MLAAGGEVLLERLPAAGKGGQGVVWQLQELSEQAVRDIWRVRVFQRERGEEKNQSGKLQGIPLAWRSRERGRSPERVAIREEGIPRDFRRKLQGVKLEGSSNPARFVVSCQFLQGFKSVSCITMVPEEMMILWVLCADGFGALYVLLAVGVSRLPAMHANVWTFPSVPLLLSKLWEMKQVQ